MANAPVAEDGETASVAGRWPGVPAGPACGGSLAVPRVGAAVVDVGDGQVQERGEVRQVARVERAGVLPVPLLVGVEPLQRDGVADPVLALVLPDGGLAGAQADAVDGAVSPLGLTRRFRSGCGCRSGGLRCGMVLVAIRTAVVGTGHGGPPWDRVVGMSG